MTRTRRTALLLAIAFVVLGSVGMVPPDDVFHPIRGSAYDRPEPVMWCGWWARGAPVHVCECLPVRRETAVAIAERVARGGPSRGAPASSIVCRDRDGWSVLVHGTGDPAHWWLVELDRAGHLREMSWVRQASH